MQGDDPSSQLQGLMSAQASLHRLSAMANRPKEDKIKELDSVKTYYECSNAKAEQILKILTKEQLNFIKSKLDIGGRQ